MAQELQIRQSQDRVKLRNPWAVALLPFVTFGIYHLVWWYRVNREMRDFGRARSYDLGQSPTSSLLALFPGGLIIIPALVSYWRGTKRVMGTARVAGKDPVNGWIALILYLVVAPAMWAYLQVSLNNAWRAEAEALPGEALPAQTSQMPPRMPEPEPAGAPPSAPESPAGSGAPASPEPPAPEGEAPQR
jgi:hypothetical protein